MNYKFVVKRTYETIVEVEASNYEEACKELQNTDIYAIELEQCCVIEETIECENRMYYHVIEDGGYGNTATHGWYEDQSEALKEANRLQEIYTDIIFYVYPSTSPNEPEFVTI